MAYYGTTQLEAMQGNLPIERLPVAASQTLKVGNLVYLAAGLVTGLAAGTYDATSNSSAGFMGVMAEDSASQAVNTLVSVIPLNDNVIVTSRSSVTPTLAQLNTDVQIIVAATTLEVQVKSDTTSNGCAHLINLDFTDSGKRNGNKEIIGTIPANARMRWKLKAASRQHG